MLRHTSNGLHPPDGTLDAAMHEALALLVTPDVRVDLDVVVRQSGREWRVHSWQGRRANRISALSTIDADTYELVWDDATGWGRELARGATVGVTSTARVLPDRVDLPLELLLATGEAWGRGRPELVEALAQRRRADLSVDGGVDGRVPDDPGSLLTALHREAIGRLQALVRRPGQRGTGQVTWLHHGDGWRQLTPRRREGQRLIRFQRVDEDRLGVEVARLAHLLRPQQGVRP